jgi:hypothetical protein
MARQAGMAQAERPVASSTKATAAFVAGSVGFTSKSWEASRRPVPTVAAPTGLGVSFCEDIGVALH